MSTALARRSPVTESALDLWQPKQIDLVKHTIMPEGSNDGELALFLEVCARYELDPFSNQIWAVRYQGKVRNVVARDGWIALANRHADYRGVQSFEIRQFDFFDRTIDDDGHVHVDHRMLDAEGKPTHGGRDGMLRGPIVAGFAYARRLDHVDTHFLAYSQQYDKSGDPKHNAWKSHETAMHVKVAEAQALKKMYPLSGLYAEGELTPDRTVTNLTAPGSPIAIDFGDDEELAAKLQDAFRALGYTRAKVRTIMRGCEDDEARRLVLEQLEREAELPVEGEVVDAA